MHTQTDHCSQNAEIALQFLLWGLYFECPCIKRGLHTACILYDIAYVCCCDARTHVQHLFNMQRQPQFQLALQCHVSHLSMTNHGTTLLCLLLCTSAVGLVLAARQHTSACRLLHVFFFAQSSLSPAICSAGI